jgi:hypothetical protein
VKIDIFVFGVEPGHSPCWNFFRPWHHERSGAGWTVLRSSVPKEIQPKSATVTEHCPGAVCLNIRKHIMCLRVPADNRNIERLFTQAALTDWC